MKQKTQILKYPSFLYMGGVFLLVGISLFFINGNDFYAPVFFILVGMAFLLGSNMICKKARIELTEQRLEFFNQIGFKFRSLSIQEICEVQMNDDQLYIQLDTGKTVKLTQHNYSKAVLEALNPQLRALIQKEI